MNISRSLILTLALCAAILLFAHTASAQQWVKHHGFSNLGRLTVDREDNAFITSSRGGIVIKLGADGTELWHMYWKVPVCTLEVAPTICGLLVDSAGDVFVLGKTWMRDDCDTAWVGGDYHLRKLAPDGSVLLEVEYAALDGRPSTPSMQLDAAGNIYIAGATCRDSASTFRQAFLVLKYDPSGTLLWERRFDDSANWGWSRNTGAAALCIDDSGDVVVSGMYFTSNKQAKNDVAILKYDTDGNLLWFQRYDYNNLREAPGYLRADSAANVYLYVSIDNSSPRVLKYDAAGTLLWEVPILIQDVYGFEADRSGNFYLAGCEGLQAVNMGGPYCPLFCNWWYYGGNYVVRKYNSNGVIAWERIFDTGASLHDAAFDIKVSDSGNIFVTGRVGGAGTEDPWTFPGTDIGTLKYDPDGTLLWSRFYGGSGADEGSHLATNAAGNVWVGGSFVVDWGEWGDPIYGAVTMRYNPCDAAVTPAMFGDMTGDDRLDARDIILLVAYILRGGDPPPICEIFGDVQCDGPVDFRDVMYLVNYEFKGGPSPCGDDPCNHPLVGTCP